MAQQPRRTVHRLASMRKHGTSAAALLLSPENCQSPTLCPITSNSGDDASIDKNAHLRTRTWNGSSRSSLEQLHRDLDAKDGLINQLLRHIEMIEGSSTSAQRKSSEALLSKTPERRRSRLSIFMRSGGGGSREELLLKGSCAPFKEDSPSSKGFLPRSSSIVSGIKSRLASITARLKRLGSWSSTGGKEDSNEQRVLICEHYTYYHLNQHTITRRYSHGTLASACFPDAHEVDSEHLELYLTESSWLDVFGVPPFWSHVLTPVQFRERKGRHGLLPSQFHMQLSAVDMIRAETQDESEIRFLADQKVTR